MPAVRILPQDVVVHVDYASPLLAAVALAAQARPELFDLADLFHDEACHGFAEVSEGSGRLGTLSPEEVRALSSRRMPIGSRPVRHLCQTLVLGDVTVRLLPGPAVPPGHAAPAGF